MLPFSAVLHCLFSMLHCHSVRMRVPKVFCLICHMIIMRCMPGMSSHLPAC